jgi:tRNA pseudouridine13 synthase
MSCKVGEIGGGLVERLWGIAPRIQENCSRSMKVKQQPEDFQVEELTDVTPEAEGPFALYRLRKRGWTTPEALSVLRRRWKIEPRRLSYGGLKDRHALTVQYLTIFRGPQRNLDHQGITVQYLGQTARNFVSTDIRANRFLVTVRSLTSANQETALRALDELRTGGVPNYFDDQRFGSVEAGGEFIGRLLVLGRFEDALRQALTAPYDHDRSEEKREKEFLFTHWGDWATLRARLPRGQARTVVDYLRFRPDDFRGAFVRLNPEFRMLYLSTYQSHLWNRMLGRCIEERLSLEQILRVKVKLGTLVFWQHLKDEQRRELAELGLPLPSARLHLPENDERLRVANAILAEEGLELRQMQVKGVRELFFSKGERATVCLPVALIAEEGDDELNSGRGKLTLAFELPRGSYATLIVKRITAEPAE